LGFRGKVKRNLKELVTLFGNFRFTIVMSLPTLKETAHLQQRWKIKFLWVKEGGGVDSFAGFRHQKEWHFMRNTSAKNSVFWLKTPRMGNFRVIPIIMWESLWGKVLRNWRIESQWLKLSNLDPSMWLPNGSVFTTKAQRPIVLLLAK